MLTLQIKEQLGTDYYTFLRESFQVVSPQLPRIEVYIVVADYDNNTALLPPVSIITDYFTPGV